MPHERLERGGALLPAVGRTGDEKAVAFKTSALKAGGFGFPSFVPDIPMSPGYCPSNSGVPLAGLAYSSAAVKALDF